jgi:dTDP-4-dehydrorhamnose 3,5-epimerase
MMRVVETQIPDLLLLQSARSEVSRGFYTLGEWADVIYKVTDYFAPEWDRTLRWDDPELGIEWPLVDGAPPLLSKKDAQGVELADAETFP